jgi:hypothetical protein
MPEPPTRIIGLRPEPGDWFLIERSEADIRVLCEQAGVPWQAVSIERDETGLAMLVDVVKQPGMVA